MAGTALTAALSLCFLGSIYAKVIADWISGPRAVPLI